MSTGQTSSLISAIAQLVGVLVWPAVLVFLVIKFRGAFADFLANLGEFTVKAPGVEASGKRQEAAVALGAAMAAPREGDGGSREAVADPRDVAKALPSPRAQRRLQGARVLWVDDKPINNRYERQALEALGVNIDPSLSTEEALVNIRQRSYDLIISDMARPEDQRAGLTLLDELRKRGNQTPYIIYAGVMTPTVREAREHGAIGATDLPQELITLVTNALAARH